MNPASLNVGTALPNAPLQIKAKLTAKRALLITVVVLGTLGLGGFLYHWTTVGRFIESTDDAYVGGNVTVIAPKVPGFISEILIADNQAVHQDDLLVKLDNRDFRAALARAQAAVALQKATQTNLDAQLQAQIAVVDQARAEVVAADAETERARNDHARFKTLVAEAAVSAQAFENADAARKIAVAGGDRSRAVLAAAQQQLEVIATQKQEAQAALNAAEAELEIAELNLSYTELRAPMDGLTGNRSAQIGAYATIGSQLMSLIPSHGLWVDANFKEDQLARIHPGAPATVKVDLLGGKKLCGHVVSIAPATGSQFSILPSENATGNFTKIVQRVAVRILLDGDNALSSQLRPGLSVTAWVDTR